MALQTVLTSPKVCYTARVNNPYKPMGILMAILIWASVFIGTGVVLGCLIAWIIKMF